MTRDEVMRELEKVCEEKGVKVFYKNGTYKNAWLYWPLLKSIIIFNNASEALLNMLLSAL